MLHGRAGVRQATHARVKAALRELDRQAASVALDGKRIAIDVILEAPLRFSRAVRLAFEEELEGLRPASLRLRFHMAEAFEPVDLDRLLGSIARRGTHGIVAKLPDRPSVVSSLSKIIKDRIPVVTLVTDLPESGRIAYIGMDNLVAGRMAAYLVQKQQAAGDILAVVSSNEFQGEAARLIGFREALDGRRLHIVDGAMGRDAQTAEKMREFLDHGHRIGAVYSAGGGNRAILQALERYGQTPNLYVAHDLDADNRDLLRSGQIDFVIHHDLRHDARASCQHILKALRLLPHEFAVNRSAIQLATPFNIQE